MALRDDLKIWNPMYIKQTKADGHAKIITAEEWNANWNLLITEADHTSTFSKNLRDMLYETVLSDTNGATAVKFTHANFTATDVSAALIELDAQDVANQADYIARDTALASDYNGKFATQITTINANESARNTRNTADEQALATHKSSTDHDGRYTPTASLTKALVGLGNVDNTSDLNKPISSAVQTALDLKATVASLNAHKAGADHDGRYAFLANETPFTPTAPYHLVTKSFQEQKISEAVLSGIADNSITDGKMAAGNKKADIVAAAVAEALPLIPPAPFDFDTPVGKAGWAYTVTGTGPVTEQYKLGATVKCSRVTSFDTPSAGKTQIVTTAPDGKVTTQVYNADGSADPITEV